MGGVALASIDGCILRIDEDIIEMQDACTSRSASGGCILCGHV